MTRRLAALLVILVCLVCAGAVTTVPLYIAATLGFGWVRFLGRVSGQITVSPGGVFTALMSLTLLIFGLHAFAAWIYRQTEKPDEPRPWKLRWTGAIVGVIVLAFVAGIAAIGVTHQTTWLVTSKEPFFTSSFGNASGRAASANNLKQATLAVINHCDQNQPDHPLSVLMDSQGRLLHGWHTQILPQMDLDPLYSKIDLGKPWDDPANREAMSTEMKSFLHTLIDERKSENGYALSHYAANVHVLGYRMPLFASGFPDGHAQTIAIGEVSTNLKPWGHPVGWRDPALGLHRSADGFGGPVRDMTQFSLWDGSVRTISDKVSPKTLKAASTPAGKDVLGDDW